jgi:hypothetical protein
MEVQKRCETLADFPALSECFYQEPEVDTALLLSEKMGVADLAQAREALEFGLDTIKFIQIIPVTITGRFQREPSKNSQNRRSREEKWPDPLAASRRPHWQRISHLEHLR